MFFGKEVRIILKGQGKEAYLELKKKRDKEANTILNSFNRVKEILKMNSYFEDLEPAVYIKTRLEEKKQEQELKNFINH